jgi:uncharacterized protein (TIGR02996 family)
MTIPPGFLHAILESPEDDVPRLILADYLEERNAPGDEWRADLIRVQCQLAACERMPDRPTDPLRRAGWLMAWHREFRILQAIREDRDPCDCELCLRQREKDLLETQPHPNFWPNESLVPVGVWSLREFGYILRRGFVDEVTMPARDWVKHGPGLLRVQPVQKVVLTGVLTDLEWWHGRVVPYNLPCPLREIVLKYRNRPDVIVARYRQAFRSIQDYIVQHLPGVSVRITGFGEAGVGTLDFANWEAPEGLDPLPQELQPPPH